MTVKEFANKYGIPYHIAYEATYKVKPVSTMRRDREFPEDEMFEATSELITERINKHTKLVSQANKAYISLHSTRAKEGYSDDLSEMRRENTDD